MIFIKTFLNPKKASSTKWRYLTQPMNYIQWAWVQPLIHKLSVGILIWFILLYMVHIIYMDTRLKNAYNSPKTSVGGNLKILALFIFLRIRIPNYET